MNENLVQAMEQSQIVHITTTGRKSGLSRRIPVRLHYIDGCLYIAGSPEPKSWYANILINPAITLHLEHVSKADLPANARPVYDRKERYKVLSQIDAKCVREGDLEEWVNRSPLVKITFDL